MERHLTNSFRLIMEGFLHVEGGSGERRQPKTSSMMNFPQINFRYFLFLYGHTHLELKTAKQC